jgi:hypothetical protein
MTIPFLLAILAEQKNRQLQFGDLGWLLIP